MSISKPDLSRVWAAGANPADIIDPDVGQPGKFDLGWVAELPPYEYFNFLQQLFTQGLAHNNEQGVNSWDATTVYPIDALTKGSNGQLYKAIVEQANNDPVTDGGNNWKLFLDLATTNTLEMLYPVGEMLITIRTGNPNTWLNFGTWIRLGEGRTMVGYDGGDADFNPVKKVGGVKDVTLTVAQMPAHTHNFDRRRGDGEFQLGTGNPADTLVNIQTSSTGGGDSHTNLQPYLVVNLWERTV